MLSLIVWTSYALVAVGLIYFAKKVLSGNKPIPKPVFADQPLRTDSKPSGLVSDIFQEGTGEGAKHKDTLTVHYTAYLTDGRAVDSSYDRGYPMTFRLGMRTVIDGWEEALKGAKVGEKRKVTVPPKLCYGKKGKNKVPPNATVIFEIEVIKIET